MTTNTHTSTRRRGRRTAGTSALALALLAATVTAAQAAPTDDTSGSPGSSPSATASMDNGKRTGLSGGAREISADADAPQGAASLSLAALSCGTVTSQDGSDAAYLNGVLTQKMAGSVTSYRASCARRVAEAVRARGLDIRAAEIATSVIIVETAMDNLDGGDRDSVGLFQQRDSWGTFAQRTNPTTATNLFLDEMVRMYPNNSWTTASPGLVAANVQRPAAEYRDRYAQNMSDAVKISHRLWAPPAPALPAMSAATISGSGDFTGDGVPDVLGYHPTRDNGSISVYPGTGTGGVGAAVSWGAGWSMYNALLRADFNSDGKQDIIARVKATGDLNFYEGTGSGGVQAAVKISNTAGWNQFEQLASPGDLSGDGRADILAASPSGELRVYTVVAPSAGAVPLVTSATTIASGWDRFKEIVTPGDMTRDGKSDVLGIDGTTGELLLYAGTGAKTLSFKATIGAGWQTFHNVSGLGDFTGDGLVDVAAVGGTSPFALNVYKGSSNPASPVGGGKLTYGAGWNQFTGLF